MYLRASSAEVKWEQLHPMKDAVRETASGG
jgi:hypothetical protein